MMPFVTKPEMNSFFRSHVFAWTAKKRSKRVIDKTKVAKTLLQAIIEKVVHVNTVQQKQQLKIA